MVAPGKITTLREWAARWPGAGNLGFDPETREPAVFDPTDVKKQVDKIKWERAADTITILTQPTRFPAQARAAAQSRIDRVREQRLAYTQAAADQLRTAESDLLAAWAAYHAAPPVARGGLRRDVITAEKAVRDIESALANQVYKGRHIVAYPGNITGVYVPPMPVDRRGISLTAVAEGTAGS